jgi:hypothetical protein
MAANCPLSSPQLIQRSPSLWTVAGPLEEELCSVLLTMINQSMKRFFFPRVSTNLALKFAGSRSGNK